MNNKTLFIKNDLIKYIDKKDIKNIINIGIYYGFIDNDIRFEIYLLLFNKNLDNILHDYDIKPFDEDAFETIKDSSVIKVDIQRTFNNKHILKNSNINKDELKATLTTMISYFFIKNKSYQYYQGFNSLFETLYLNFGKPISLFIIEQLSKIVFKNYLEDNLMLRVTQKIDKIKLFIKELNMDLYEVIKNELFNK